MKQEEFLEIFNLLQLNYGKEIPNEIIRIWYDQFKDTKKEIFTMGKTSFKFRESVIDYISQEKTFPTINEINSNVEFYTRRRF